MIPIISNIKLLRIMVEKNKSNKMMAAAPVKAASRTSIKPEILKGPAIKLPPKSNITTATPKLAPELIPKIDGSAKGFTKTVCSSNPLTAKPAPQNKAVTACGKRDSRTIKEAVDVVSAPVNASQTCIGENETVP